MKKSDLQIRLIEVDDALDQALERPGEFLRRYGADVAEHVELARGVVRQSLDFYARVKAHAPWIGYLTADAATSVVVGSCGFKGDPTQAAEVEIAYGTFPPFEGRGFATAMARELVAIARAAAGVKRAIAHTLPERNASCRVLEKAGFQKAGEVIDPEDGLVWRWTLALRE